MLGLTTFARKFFGSVNDRKLSGYLARVEKINALEPDFQGLSDDALKAKTTEFKQRLADGA